MRRVRASLAVFSVVLTVIACNSEVGEECDEEGKVGGECVEGAVCGRATGGGLECLKQCTNPGDCASGETCGAVGETSLRGCRAN